MTYPKIETLYERDETTHRLKTPLILKNPVYGLLKSWQFTEKIDGTNIRCMWQPLACTSGHPVEGTDKFCAFCGIELTEKVPAFKLTFGGKTDNAQIHADLINWLHENVRTDYLRIVFPETRAVLYGEGYGAGIQKGGDLSPIKKIILFDVLVAEKWWLSDANVRDVAANLHLDAVPFVGDMTLDEAAAMVRAGFPSRLNGGQAQAEGLVGKPAETLFDKKGARLIVKLKTKDF